MRDTRRDWTPAEVSIIVAAYLEMLVMELRGQQYSKAAMRRSIMPSLCSRSPTSVERKNMNISAVLQEMGLPYINGYKPYGNIQRSLLPQEVRIQVSRHTELRRLLPRPT